MEEVSTHSLVAHFREEHGGERQELLMRMVFRHLTALERQAVESVIGDYPFSMSGPKQRERQIY